MMQLPLPALYVTYEADDGQTKRQMVGKPARHLDYGWVWHHQHYAPKHHVVTGCPMPVDVKLARLLVAHQIKWFFSFETAKKEDVTGTLWYAPLDQIVAAEQRFHNGRFRYYLSAAAWRGAAGVVGWKKLYPVTVRVTAGRRRDYFWLDTLILSTPYVREERDLDCEALPKEG